MTEFRRLSEDRLSQDEPEPQPGCYRATPGCSLPGGHHQADCEPVRAARKRVQAFLRAIPHDEVLTTGYGDDATLLAGDLHAILRALEAR